MGELFNELDQNDADELAETNQVFAAHEQVVNDQGQVAFSKHEEMQFKAAQVKSSEPKPAVSTGKLVPTANPFSKKRQHSEISSATPTSKSNGNGHAAANLA